MYHFEKNNPLATIPIIGFFTGILVSIRYKEYLRVACTITTILGLAIYGYYTYGSNLDQIIKYDVNFFYTNTHFFKREIEYVSAICMVGLIIRLTSKGVKQSLQDGKFKFMPLLVYPFAAIFPIGVAHSHYNWNNERYLTGDLYISTVLGLIAFFLFFKPIADAVLFGWYSFWYWLTNSVDGYASGEIQKQKAERKAGQTMQTGTGQKRIDEGEYNVAAICSSIICVIGIIWSVYYFADAGKSARGFTGVFVLFNIVFCILFAFAIRHEPDGTDTKWDEKRREYVTVYVWRRLNKEEEQRDRANLVIPTWVYACNIGAFTSICLFKLDISLDNYFLGFLAFGVSVIIAGLIMLFIAETAKEEVACGRRGGGYAMLLLLYMSPCITVIWAVCNLLFNL
ncbi:hypothetical protein I7Z51_002513 [Vibrio parahaemolyticus]|uniref:hypothetical protein n=1 Tax=Vibrio TaxID=662 RepID=UPI001A8D70A3|nr:MULTISPECIES: hypothetical protein [Vibrio]EGQ7973590.1 hypothetical protein [Vibrio parahaemolyticus]MBO0209797.1 hypothetical protein [Vibrio sp. Vb0877]MCR9811859.1 hypothetical protein [Vibrio parahaemolyticus]MDW2320281.1 hypothetical protein [Vibrio sp. 1159]